MPAKFTWKSISGLLAIIAGAVTAAAGSGLPTSVSTVLVAIGGVVIAAERVADSVDNATAVANPPTTQTVTVPPGHTVQVVPVAQVPSVQVVPLQPGAAAPVTNQ